MVWFFIFFLFFFNFLTLPHDFNLTFYISPTPTALVTHRDMNLLLAQTTWTQFMAHEESFFCFNNFHIELKQFPWGKQKTWETWIFFQFFASKKKNNVMNLINFPAEFMNFSKAYFPPLLKCLRCQNFHRRLQPSRTAGRLSTLFYNVIAGEEANLTRDNETLIFTQQLSTSARGDLLRRSWKLSPFNVIS